jgi:S1-C subfamily serine protease
LCLVTSAFAEISNGIQESILKIYSFKSAPDYYSPWRLHEPAQQIGSGCVIEGKNIITNAHLVANANYIQFKFNRDPKKYDAKVMYVSHEVDLAILAPIDSSILNDIPALNVGELPNMLDEVLVYGFPVGGDVLSITKGVLSRVEYQTYTHNLSSLLAGQLDAAINPGNSGGPVIVDGEVVGIVMQKSSSNRIENIGYMIPAPVIRHFLTDIEDGKVDGVPAVGYTYQDMESPSLRGMYRMKPEHTGVLVKSINWDSPAAGLLKVGDVILEVDGYNVADDGTIEFRRDERIAYIYSYQKHQHGDTVQIKVLRKGKEKVINVRLDKYRKDFGLIPRPEYDMEPTFFIYGGMVFLPINYNYFCTWKNCDSPDRFSILIRKNPSKKKREYASMLRVLPAPLNKGYHGLYNIIIEKVNGKDYVDFADFYKKVVNSDSKYIVLSDDMNFQIVIDREAAIESHNDILTRYKIGKDRSENLGNDVN